MIIDTIKNVQVPEISCKREVNKFLLPRNKFVIEFYTERFSESHLFLLLKNRSMLLRAASINAVK